MNSPSRGQGSSKTKLRARRSLSQNFLIDGEIADRIARALPITPGDDVYEIGPGKGFLTERLHATGAVCHLVEKDRRMVGMLKKKFRNDPSVIIHHADVLSLPDSAQPPEHCWLVGNLPFGIGHPILAWALERGERWCGAVVTLQREVIRRLTAGPGEPGRGSVSIWFQARATGEALFDIPPCAFHPPPRVTSTVMRITFTPQTPGAVDVPGLDLIIKHAFAQPRKILANNLLSIPGLAISTRERWESKCADLMRKRAQELATSDFVRLAGYLSTP